MHDRHIPGMGVRRILLLAVFAAGLGSTLSCLGQAGESPAQARDHASGPATDATGEGPVPRLSRNEEAGRLLFERYCTFCHGAEGDGFGINASNLLVVVSDLTNLDLQAARSDRELADIIARGSLALGRSPQMPPWGRTLNLREIDALVAYIRTFARPARGREAPPQTAWRGRGGPRPKAAFP